MHIMQAMNNSLARGRLARPPLIRPSLRVVLWRVFWLALIFFLLAALVPSEGYLGAAYPELIMNSAIGSHGFKLGAWEVSAWQQKIQDAIHRPGADLSPTAQHDLVVGYFANIDKIDDLSRQIEASYADVSQSDPKAAAAALQAELDGLRATQRSNRPAVESILQNQVSEVLAANGLLTANRLWPPVLFHFSESPDVLIVSPRDHIALDRSAFVQPGQPVAEWEHIEGQVEQGLNESVLVDGTGGFSAYPTMVVEYSDLRWVLSTIAHEWFHTYLAFYPLGWHYFDNGDTRTLNETSASLFGDELGDQVLSRFYPERVPPPPPPPAPAQANKVSGQPVQPKQPRFSFGATMRNTRLKVDELLSQGKITEAEAYMEAQREVLAAHGYILRKLNQAYFAFHGSYAVGPSATDPIGDKLRALRERSTSLRTFVQTVRGVTSVAQLDELMATR
jgi:hypothetical protein